LDDAAGFAVEPGEAPALAAEPADILFRVAPAGEFPIENAGQPGSIHHVVAGAEIAVAQHRRERRRDMGFEPADRRFEHRPRLWVMVEIGAEAGNLRLGTALVRRWQKVEIRARRPDRLDPRQLPTELA